MLVELRCLDLSDDFRQPCHALGLGEVGAWFFDDIEGIDS